MSLFHKFRALWLDWTWEEIVPSGGSEPSGNRGGALFARDGTGKFVLVGGRNHVGSDLTDYWSFDYGGTNQWTQVVASGLTNVTLPTGYADGSGNILVTAGYTWDSFSASTTQSKIAVASGAQTALTDSGTGASVETAAQLGVDIANKTIFSGRVGSFNYNGGYALTSAVQNTGANTSTKTAKTSSTYNRVAASSLGYHPSGNALYALASNVAYNGGTWTLDTGCVYKYDLTAGTGWAAVTGVTNNAGAITMPAWPQNQAQRVWSATESKFFIFVTSGTNHSCARVLTFDPATKTLAQVLFTGAGPAYVLGEYDGYSLPRGNCGTVVETSGAFYFCTCAANAGLTKARIWKFRRT